MEPSLLALDLALNSGVSHWKPGMDRPYASELKIDRTLPIGARLASLYKWCLRFTREHGITDISVETPLTTAGHEDKIFWLISAYGVIRMLGAQTNIDVDPVPNRDWYPHWAGSNNFHGDERKQRSILEVQRRGLPAVKSHDVADSLGVLTYRIFKMRLKAPWDTLISPGPLFETRPKGVTITKANERAAAIITNKALSFEREKT